MKSKISLTTSLIILLIACASNGSYTRTVKSRIVNIDSALYYKNKAQECINQIQKIHEQ